MKRYYPVFLDLEGKVAAVVGDGPEVAVRTLALLDAGALVRVVARHPSAALRDLADAGRIELRARVFEPGDLDGAVIAIATHDAGPAVRDEATSARVPLNVVDRAELCDWIHGAVLRRGALVAAVSTSGAAPALAVRLRDELGESLGPEYARFLEIAAEQRGPIARTGLDFAARRALWYRLADSDALAALRDGDESKARAIFAGEVRAAVEAAAASARGVA